MTDINHIISRLTEPGIKSARCLWCLDCMHVIAYRDGTRGATVINLGSDGCKKPIKNGSVKECIDDLLALTPHPRIP